MIRKDIYELCKKYVHDKLVQDGYRTTEDIQNTYFKTFYILVSDYVFEFTLSEPYFKDMSFDEHQEAVDKMAQDFIFDFKKDFNTDNKSERQDEERFFTEDDIKENAFKLFVTEIRDYLKRPKETRPEVEFEYKGKVYRGIPALEVKSNQFVFYIDGKMKTIDVSQVTPIE